LFYFWRVIVYVFLYLYFFFFFLFFFFFFFFFSSRRRHTRSYGDWSSDVCSSDLASCVTSFAFSSSFMYFMATPKTNSRSRAENRSEERRVGKECRSRWWPYH